MPQGVTYSPCPDGFRGFAFLKDKIYEPLYYAEQNDDLKILIGCV